MKFISILVLFLISIISLLTAPVLLSVPPKSPSDIVYQFIGQTANYIHSKFGLIPVGTGAAFPDKLENIFIHFHLNRPMKVDEARKLIVNVANDIIEKMNQSNSLKSYLDCDSATGKNVKVFIEFTKSNGTRYSPPNVALIIFSNGDIVYDYYDNQNKKFIDDKTHKEIFEEAKRILAKQKLEKSQE